MSTVPTCGTPGLVSSAGGEMTKGFRHKPSRVDILCTRGRESTVGLTEVTTSRSQTANEPAPECGIEPCPQSPTSSLNGSCEGTIVDSFSDVTPSLAAAPRGRHRAPPSPRGRPSSPLRPGASSSPSRRASGSPAPGRRRDGPVPSSPLVGGHSVESEVDEALATSLVHSPPPPDLPRACYYGMAGLSDDILDDGPRPGAFWKAGSTRRSTISRSLYTAISITMSYSKEPLAKAERGTSSRVSSSSSSSSAVLEKATTTTTITNNNTNAAAAAAAAEPAVRKKARRVTWSPMVLAREEAAAYIRPHVKRYFEAEEVEFRAAYTEAVTRKFDQRRAAERAERKRGGAPAATTCPPAAKRGAFFGLLASLYKPEWMGYKMWPQDPFYASAQLLLAGNVLPVACRGGGFGGISAPPGRATNLGDAVKGMAAAMQSRRGQCRA